jgi:hypothetical protein
MRRKGHANAPQSDSRNNRPGRIRRQIRSIVADCRKAIYSRASYPHPNAGHHFVMKRILIAILTPVLFTLSSYAGELWKEENGSYVSTDWNSVVTLYNTKHGTSRYRAIRDLLIARGILQPCYPGQVVEATGYSEGIATIVDGNGNVFYIQQEDFVRYLGARGTHNNPPYSDIE